MTNPGSSGQATSAELLTQIESAANVADILRATAKLFPHTPAVAEAPRRRRIDRQAYRQIDFRELDRRATIYAGQLQRDGVPPGTRLALMVRPGIDFVALFFALLRSGAVTILIDPGMSRRNLVRCLAAAVPAGIVGIPRAHAARWIFRRHFPDCRWNYVVGGGFPGARRIVSRADPTPPFERAPIDLESPAAIIFTTGSTGPPKGVLYRHRTFVRQAIDVSRYFGLPAGGADISGFPLFALFNAAMGVTTVFPRMDFTRPAAVDPRNFVAAVQAWSATQSFGSPALWNTVAEYCERKHLRLPTIRHVLSAGAPVPIRTLERIQALIADDGQVHTPYGATEALPVACITAREVLRDTAARTRDGGGACVGRRFPDIRWQVIRIADHPLPRWEEDCQLLPPGEIGELIVSGPVVTDRYVTRTEANALHKIADGDRVWHRMGDVGYLDEDERFWFCGRKSHRVTTATEVMYTIPCEAIFNQHPAVYRSALVGVGPPPQRPAVVVEPHRAAYPHSRGARAQLLDQLQALARSHPLTRSIQDILIRRRLPVDIRHNSKIFREQLAIWAANRLTRRPVDGDRVEATS